MDDYVVKRVQETCAAQGLTVVPEPAVIDVIAAMIADRPVQTEVAA